MTLCHKPKIARAFLPLLRPARYKGAKGGRGAAKSHFFAELAIAEAVSFHMRVVCAREIQNSIDESVKLLLEDKIHSNGLSDMFDITDNEISCPATDSLFIFRGLRKHTVSSIKSLEGFNRLWIEEAQTVSQKSIEVATPTFRVKGSQIWMSWNPNSPTDPVEKLFNDNIGDPEFECVTVNYPDNPWFPDELRADMERDKARDFDKYLHVWMGGYLKHSESRVFKNWKVEQFETPSNSIFYYGADWGFSVDPTVLVRCFIQGRTLFIDAEVYKVGCEIDATPALFDTIDKSNFGVARDAVIRADSARPETISYMRRHGYKRIVSAVKGAGSVEDGIEFMKSYDIVVHPRCKHTIDELTYFSFKTDPLTNEVTNVLSDKKNHVIDAIRYAVESVRRKPVSKTTTIGGVH